MNCPSENSSHCRCEFVQKWLDNHEKYFTKQPSTQREGLAYIAHRTYGPSQVHYGFTGNIQYTPQVVRLPYTMQPPFRISPNQPPKP